MTEPERALIIALARALLNHLEASGVHLRAVTYPDERKADAMVVRGIIEALQNEPATEPKL